jgi:hypothetical protein
MDTKGRQGRIFKNALIRVHLCPFAVQLLERRLACTSVGSGKDSKTAKGRKGTPRKNIQKCL